MYNVFQRKHHHLLLYYFEGVFGLRGPRTAFPTCASNNLQSISPLHNPISNMNNMNLPVYTSKKICVVTFHHCLREEGQGGCQAVCTDFFCSNLVKKL